MKKNGFTLIEIMIVIAIIGVLSVMGFSSYEGTKKSARDSRRKTDLETIRGAFELYFADAKAYPTSLNTCGTGNIAYGSIVYLNKVPCDPNGGGYGFAQTVAGKDYKLGAKLEKEEPELNCITGYNYCVTNP